MNLKAEAISTAAFSTLADVLLLILPIPTLWGLQLPKQQKLALVFIFLLGGLYVNSSTLSFLSPLPRPSYHPTPLTLKSFSACIAAIIRIVFLSRGTTSFVDFTYIEVDSLNWSLIEPCVGIVCACLPTLRPLFRKIPFLGLRSAQAKGSENSGQSGNSGGTGGSRSFVRSLKEKVGLGAKSQGLSSGESANTDVERAWAGYQPRDGLQRLDSRSDDMRTPRNLSGFEEDGDRDMEMARYAEFRRTHELHFGEPVSPQQSHNHDEAEEEEVETVEAQHWRRVRDQRPPTIAEQRLTDPRLLNVVRPSSDEFSGSEYSEPEASGVLSEVPRFEYTHVEPARYERFSHAM